MSREWNILPKVLGEAEDEVGLFIGFTNDNNDLRFQLFSRCTTKDNEIVTEIVCEAYEWDELLDMIQVHFGEILSDTTTHLSLTALRDVQGDLTQAQETEAILRYRELQSELNDTTLFLREKGIIVKHEIVMQNHREFHYPFISTDIHKVL